MFSGSLFQAEAIRTLNRADAVLVLARCCTSLMPPPLVLYLETDVMSHTIEQPMKNPVDENHVREQSDVNGLAPRAHADVPHKTAHTCHIYTQ